MEQRRPSDGAGEEAGFSGWRRMMVRLLHLYFRLTRSITFGVRAAVLTEAGEVFLIRHTYVPGWQLPGGGVEVGETALQALARELSEEACIALTEPPRLHGLYFNGRISRRDHVALYVVRAFRVESVKQPDREIAEAGFFPLDSLPDGVTPATRRRLEEITANRPAAADW
ncbi:NUDIX domain-containing protein [Bosea sp. (in: a-proteobacteria)]|uniref:NUDIX domain-containing protein n=1 Tax=Bosea sp. (in: a-proteobacteria) TaxID=1871050 RepID=UPI001AC692F9|nr:NUDIX domain-containing protein [Bosea sp. (in: a-proteobacteria)]MBN9444807.1 NUDIX domain-containing protein [Bosea sp. (in: a-proteobacteria)]MBN9450157.1 NUDIX domain-containing protein [Bosea sp. (in: a-proteobacteria)]